MSIKITKIKILILTVFWVLGIASLAYSKNLNVMQVASKSFETGDYVETIRFLTLAEKKQPEEKALIHYWRGVTHNRLAEYDKGILYLTSASKFNSNKKFKDLFYELGQAFFASLDYKNAVKAFMQSFRLNYKPAESLYYVASALQEQKKYNEAQKVYKKIIKVKGAAKDLIQLAEYQVAEIHLILAQGKNEKQKWIREDVLPQLNRAYEVDEKSLLAEEILSRYEWLKRKYDFTPDEMINGRVIPDNRFSFQLSETLSYDTNVIQEANQTTERATEKASWLSTTEAYISQKMPIKRRFFLVPKAEISFIRHFDREVPIIYQNDELGVGGGTSISYEHKAYKKPASLFLDFDYEYVKRDLLRDKTLRFNNESFEFYLGEKFKKFQGDTTIKVKYEKNLYYTTLLDTTTFGIQLGQVIPIGTTKIFIVNFISDINQVQDDTKSNQSYTLRGDLLYSKNWNKKKWHMYTTVTALDTKKQQSLRGTELYVSPGVAYTVTWKKIDWKVDYNYTRNSSRSKELYDYTKHVISFNLELGF